MRKTLTTPGYLPGQPREGGASRLLIRPYSPGELSSLYTVSKNTFRKWIKPFEDKIGERNGRFYTVAQVEIILEKLGVPHYLDDL